MSRRTPEPILVNKTPFRGDDLRRFTLAAIRARGAEGAVKMIEYRISPSHRATGLTYCEESRIIMNFPRGYNARAYEDDLTEVAQILIHEIDHVLGLDHKDMRRLDDLEVPWIQGVRLRRRKNVPVRPVVEALESKIRSLVLALDEVWTPIPLEVRVLGGRRTRRTPRRKRVS